MNKSIAIALLLISTVTACNSGAASPVLPTAAVLPTTAAATTAGTSGSTVKPTATPSKPNVVQTSAGAMQFLRTNLATGWPLKCDPAAAANDAKRCFVKPKPGFGLFIVYYTDVTLDAKASGEVYATEDDKTTQIRPTMAGAEVNDSYYGFMISSATKQVVLHLPGGATIKLVPFTLAL